MPRDVTWERKPFLVLRDGAQEGLFRSRVTPHRRGVRFFPAQREISQERKHPVTRDATQGRKLILSGPA